MAGIKTTGTGDRRTGGLNSKTLTLESAGGMCVVLCENILLMIHEETEIPHLCLQTLW